MSIRIAVAVILAVIVPVLGLGMLFYWYSAQFPPLKLGTLIRWDRVLEAGPLTANVSINMKLLSYLDKDSFVVKLRIIDRASGRVLTESTALLAPSVFYMPPRLLGGQTLLLDNISLKLVGLEDVETPAGMFKAYHYNVKVDDSVIDVWFDSKTGVLVKYIAVTHKRGLTVSDYLVLTNLG